VRAFNTYWRNYWAATDEAKHRYGSREWLGLLAGELLLHFPARAVRALELGCGNGELHGFFKGRFASYVGVDFSLPMLRKFRSQWDNPQLVCADVCQLPFLEQEWDLVFSNEVCQFLKPPRLTAHLAEVHRLLAPKGLLLIGNIPDRYLRWFYYAGALRADRDPSWRSLTRRVCRMLVKRRDEDIGQWYSRRGISRLASENGFDCQTFSAVSHEYRFHALLRKVEDRGSR
jgi:SAM-dependent methyltransferase